MLSSIFCVMVLWNGIFMRPKLWLKIELPAAELRPAPCFLLKPHQSLWSSANADSFELKARAHRHLTLSFRWAIAQPAAISQ